MGDTTPNSDQSPPPLPAPTPPAPASAKRDKKPKPAPIEVPVADVPYELSLDGTFRDFRHGFEISRGGVRLGPQEPGLGMGRTPSAQDLSILGGDVGDLWARPPSVTSPLPASGTPGGTHRRNWSSGSDSELPTTPSFDVALRDLRVTGVLGRGAGGVVHSCEHAPTGTVFALKVVPLDVRDALRRRIIAELRCLHASLSCPAIVPMHGAFLCDGSVAIVLEFMDAGSLADLLTSRGAALAEEHVTCIAARVLLGVSYLHTCCHIIHRDLKPSNLLLNSRGEVKISDFGVSGQLRPGQPQSSSWLGTTRYMAPERIDGRQYSYSSDIWALGITLLECATGAHPYQDAAGGDVTMAGDGGATGTAAAAAPDFWALRERITQDAAPRLEPGRGYSAQGCDFLAHCLNKDADQRWSAEQLAEHPWVVPSPGGDDPAGEAGERRLAALVASVATQQALDKARLQQQQPASSLPTGMRLRASPSALTLHTVEE